MKILENILSETKKEKINFLIIGGHAVAAYGFARQTGDIDLLVDKGNRSYWENLLKKLDYKIYQNHEVFCKFKSNEIAAWPLDLMFVEHKIFVELMRSANDRKLGDLRYNIPSIAHMISLKLHALKHRQEHRESKDILDVIELLKRSEINPKELRQLCQRYDRIDLYDQFQKYSK